MIEQAILCYGYVGRRSFAQGDWADGSPIHPFVNAWPTGSHVQVNDLHGVLSAIVPAMKVAPIMGTRGLRASEHGHANSHLELTFRPGVPRCCGTGAAESTSSSQRSSISSMTYLLNGWGCSCLTGCASRVPEQRRALASVVWVSSRERHRAGTAAAF